MPALTNIARALTPSPIPFPGPSPEGVWPSELTTHADGSTYPGRYGECLSKEAGGRLTRTPIPLSQSSQTAQQHLQDAASRLAWPAEKASW